MATITKNWTGEGTWTSGTVITAANSAGPGGSAGNAFDNVTSVAPSTLTVGTTNPLLSGSKTARVQTTGGAGTGRSRYYWAFDAADWVKVVFALRERVDPTLGNVNWVLVDSGFGFPVQLQEFSTGGVRKLVLNVKGTNLRDYGTISKGSAIADWKVLSIYVKRSTTTVAPFNGHVVAKFYGSDGTVLFTDVHTDVNTGNLQFIRSQWGGNTDAPQDLDMSLATLTTEGSAPTSSPSWESHLLPFPAAGGPPTATIMARPAPFEPGTVTFTGSVTADTGRTVKNIYAEITEGPNSPAVTVTTSGVGGTTATVSASFPALPSARYTVRVRGIDNTDVATNMDATTVVQTYNTTGDVQPYKELTATGWSLVGTSDAITAVTDDSNGTYRESPPGPTGNAIVHMWNAFRVGSPVADITLKPVVGKGPGGATINWIGELWNSTQTTKYQTVSGFTTPDDPTTVNVIFSGAALTTVTSRVDLVSKIIPTQV